MKITPDICMTESLPEAAYAEVNKVLDSGDLFRYSANRGSAVADLEMEFAEFMGVPFALAVNSCSSAIFLSLKSLGIAPGSKVIIPAFTFSAVPSAVVHAGCIPVLVNALDNYRIDINELERKLSDDIAAVIISHMRGHVSDMDSLIKVCESRGIPLIEDAAHALGATWSGKKIGTLGQIGCFSFQSYKLINSGEGGMLITHDADIMARAVIMSGAYEHNWKKHPSMCHRINRWQNKLPLFNMRMSNLTAAAARPQIREVSRRVSKGRANHAYVAMVLNSSGFFYVPEPLKKEYRAPDSIQFNLLGFDHDADVKAFQKHAQAKGVTVQVFGLSEDNARAFWNWQFIEPQDDLSQTRKILLRACDVRLPARLDKDELDYMATALVEAAREVMGANSPVC